MFRMNILSSIAVLLIINNIPAAQPIIEDNNSSTILDEDDCPTWMHPDTKASKNSTSMCVCGIKHNYEILCNNKTMTLHIADGLAMTYDNKTHQVIAGYTPYGWTSKWTHSRDIVYRNVPPNKSLVNEHICGRFHRTGQLCGSCKQNHTPQVYTYVLHCKLCYGNNWILFLGATFLPLTAFYIFALLFKFNANSPAIHAYILASQLLYTPQIIRFYMIQYNVHSVYKVFIAMYGIWNLDFLNIAQADICLQISTLQALALGYILPCYALLLIITTYIVVELHSRGCKILMKAHSLFQKCFKVKWHYTSSIINVFATFILLSYNRLLSTHFDLLVYTKPFDQYGNIIGRYLYYDPTVQYFKGEHLPYGIFTLTICLFGTALPFLLLLFYPMKCFQRCLNVFKLNCYGLRIFADSFTGCYKDGTEPGTRDCRYFAAFFLLLRILMYATLSSTSTTYAIAINGCIIMLFLAFFVACQPYKAKFAVYNKITSIMLAIMCATYTALLGVLLSKIKTSSYSQLNHLLFIVMIILPQIYIVALTIRWMCSLTCTCTPKTELEPLIDQYEAL